MGPGDAVKTGAGNRPQVSGVVGVQADHILTQPSGPGQHGTELSVIQSLHTQRRSHPNGSVNALGHGCHRHRGQTLWFAEDRHRVTLKTDQAVCRSGPHRAIALLK